MKKPYLDICEINPNVKIDGKTFCFTGVFNFGKRKECAKAITDLQGRFKDDVVTALDYLVIGDLGSPSWKTSQYGNKIEKALKFKDDGKKILIINEIDWHLALIKIERFNRNTDKFVSDDYYTTMDTLIKSGQIIRVSGHGDIVVHDCDGEYLIFSSIADCRIRKIELKQLNMSEILKAA